MHGCGPRKDKKHRKVACRGYFSRRARKENVNPAPQDTPQVHEKVTSPATSVLSGVPCATVRTTNGGCCFFPFVYKTKLYDGCTTVGSNYWFWCATTANYDGGENWGYCLSKLSVKLEIKPKQADVPLFKTVIGLLGSGTI